MQVIKFSESSITFTLYAIEKKLQEFFLYILKETSISLWIDLLFLNKWIQMVYRTHILKWYSYRWFRAFYFSRWPQILFFILFVFSLLIAFMTKISLINMRSNIFFTPLKFQMNLSSNTLNIWQKIENRQCPVAFAHKAYIKTNALMYINNNVQFTKTFPKSLS